MTKQHTFSEVARTERYFTASLLCHLLMANNFVGAQSVFVEFYGEEICKAQHDEFEVISELDPLRDSSKDNNQIEKIFRKHKRVAVPDIFLRWGQLILVIEAKFFTYPNTKELEAQIVEQKRAINLILHETPYKEHRFKYVALAIEEDFSEKDFSDKTIGYISWSKIIEILKSCFKGCVTKDIDYSITSIEKSIKRACKELTNNTERSYQKIKTLDDLIQKIPQLINEKQLYFGFSEGINKLPEMSLEDLEGRGHYKVSHKKWSNNWHPIDLLISHIIELKINE